MPSWITLIAGGFTISWTAVAAMLLWHKTRLMRRIRAELPPDAAPSRTRSWRDLWICAHMADELAGTEYWGTLASRLEAKWRTARESIFATACVTGGCLAIEIIMKLVTAGTAAP